MTEAAAFGVFLIGLLGGGFIGFMLGRVVESEVDRRKKDD